MGPLTPGCGLRAGGGGANRIWREAWLQATGSPREGGGGRGQEADFQEGGVKAHWNLPEDGVMPLAIWPYWEAK